VTRPANGFIPCLRGRRLAVLVVVATILVAACASRTPVPSAPSALVQASGSPASPALSEGPPASSPSPGASPNSIASGPPTRTISADWPPTAESTRDPGFILHIPILMYHRIVAPADAGASLPGLVVDPIVFADEMALLHMADWHTITLATLQFDLANNLRPAPRTFVITIDDGHLDGFTNALPILRRFGFVATYFVVMGRINDSRFLSATQLQTLASDGMEIADHTMTHVNVGRLYGPPLEYQIGAAAAAIRKITGQSATSFAYPFGRSSLAAAGEVQAAGMGMAVTTQEGVLETWALRFFVPRLRVSPSVTPDKLLRMLTGYAIA
jgi:peptidoglycan/xylan/chitin deacetylase (PgdA/CDA1 family)